VIDFTAENQTTQQQTTQNKQHMQNKFEIERAVLDLLDTLKTGEAIEATPYRQETAVALQQPPAVIEEVVKPMSQFKRNKLRLMQAMEVSLTIAEQVDFTQGEAIRTRMTRGGYPNAFIKDVFSLARLKQLFNFIQWTEVTSRVTSDTHAVMQASLPKQVVAFAPWCELSELAETPGALATVKVNTDTDTRELYLSTHMRIQTKYVTVHLLKDEAGVERLLTWFPGREISSTLKDGLATQVVRTNWK
jgi:hypothetical protein